MTENSGSMTGGVDSSFEYSAPVIQPIEPKLKMESDRFEVDDNGDVIETLLSQANRAIASSRAGDWQEGDGPGLMDALSKNVAKQPFGSGKKRCLSLYLASSRSSHDESTERPQPPVTSQQSARGTQIKRTIRNTVFDYHEIKRSSHEDHEHIKRQKWLFLRRDQFLMDKLYFLRPEEQLKQQQEQIQ